MAHVAPLSCAFNTSSDSKAAHVVEHLSDKPLYGGLAAYYINSVRVPGWINGHIYFYIFSFQSKKLFGI